MHMDLFQIVTVISAVAFALAAAAIVLHLNKRNADLQVLYKTLSADFKRAFVEHDHTQMILQDLRSYQSRKELQVANLSILHGKRRRSVLFLYNSYYHFYYLAKALRRRGWDAMTVQYEDPVNGAHLNYYHGEDANLFSPDPIIFRQNIAELYADSIRRFDVLHFAGDGRMSFFPELWQEEEPKDIVLWRSLGKKVAYTISGCLSCVSQSAYARWSSLDHGRVACDKCIWQDKPDICCDGRNLKWGEKIGRYVDLICAETSPALDFLDSPKTVFDPLTMCLDPLVWSPDLHIPQEFKIPRDENEVLVFHAVGNYKMRTQEDGRNVKGTQAVVSAIEQLRCEGISVRLVFETNVRNFALRYTQAQCDVIVDQLNAGRYGATSREGMMLGKPVVCYINAYGTCYPDRMKWLSEIPIVC